MTSNNAFKMLCWAYKNDVAVGVEDGVPNIMTHFSEPGATIEKGGQHLIPSEKGELGVPQRSIWLYADMDEEQLRTIADIVIAPPKGSYCEKTYVYICIL